MLTRKTQYAWMAVGGLICLFGLALACKLRDGNKVIAQVDQPIPSPSPLTKEPPPSIFSLPPTLQKKEPDLLLSPAKLQTPKHPASKSKPSEPKAKLEKPLPLEPSSMEMSPRFMRDAGKLPEPTPPPSLVLPASFGPKKVPEDLPGPKAPKISAPVPPPSPAPLSPPTSKAPEKKSGPANPHWNAPGTVAPASTYMPYPDDSPKTQPGEPPLAPAPGPVQIYRVHGAETLHDIARRTLGSSERWSDLHKLNPMLKPDEPLGSGTVVRLPADACLQTDDAEPVKPLPRLRTKPPAPKAKVLPLTGTYQCSLDDKGRLTLPRAIRDQLGGSDTVLLSPGPDKCLWLTDPPHLERLAERLDQSQANEADVRVFKRLYFAQTEKLTVNSDGRVTLPERLGQFAGLHQEVVLVGIDDHFEVWDAARWRSYTQQKSNAPSAALAEQE